MGGRRGNVRNVGDEALNSLENARLAPPLEYTESGSQFIVLIEMMEAERMAALTTHSADRLMGARTSGSVSVRPSSKPGVLK
jgi:hypothetical protein